MLVQDFYLGKATKQDVYDFVIGQIRLQGRPSFNAGTSSCKYRYANLKCGIGFLIPDEFYSYRMDDENLGPWELFSDLADRERTATSYEESQSYAHSDGLSEEFLYDMQKLVHDKWAGIVEMRQKIDTDDHWYLDSLEESAEVFCAVFDLIYSPPSVTVTT
jgi:hypothetical protein